MEVAPRYALLTLLTLITLFKLCSLLSWFTLSFSGLSWSALSCNGSICNVLFGLVMVIEGSGGRDSRGFSGAWGSGGPRYAR